jgi:hypothetical protein
MDIVSDPCTSSTSGGVTTETFHLHPETSSGSGQVDMTSGDVWQFSPARSGYAVKDMTNGSLNHPLTDGWSGTATSP